MTTTVYAVLGVISGALSGWVIGRAQGYRVGTARTERRLERRARRSPGDALQPRDRAERVRIVRYPEPLWPRPKEKTTDGL